MTDDIYVFRATWPDRATPAKPVNKRDGQAVRVQLDSEEYDMDAAWNAWRMTHGMCVEVTLKVLGPDGTDRHNGVPNDAGARATDWTAPYVSPDGMVADG